MKPVRYQLCPQVSVAETGGALIFLDERSDRYFVLTPFQRRLYEHLSGAVRPGASEADILAFAARLKSMQLIEEGSGGLLPDTLAHSHLLTMQGASKEADRPVSAGLAAQFILSLINCACLHRFRSLSHILDQARKWKAATNPELAGSALACHLVAAFDTLSPYFFSIHDQCRFRSLLLLRFLACYGVPADWVFGVRASPFAAHCWLECGQLVLNDDPENTRQYRIILRV